MLDFHWTPIGLVVTTCSGIGFSQKFDDIGKRVYPVDESSEWELLSNCTLTMGFLVGWSHFSFPYRGQALPRYKSRGCSYLFTRLPLVPAVLRCSAVNHYSRPKLCTLASTLHLDGVFKWLCMCKPTIMWLILQ